MTKHTPLILCFLQVLDLCVSIQTLSAQDTLLKAQYVSIPYDLIGDNKVCLTPSDFDIWKSQLGELKQYYIATFDIDFTAKDSMETYEWLKKNTQNFANDFKDTTMFLQNGGKKIVLDASFSVDYMDKPIGSIITFITDDELFVSKLVGKSHVADSVRARHILLMGKSEGEVDKILGDIKSNKINWDQANKLYNNEFTGSQNGGDLGYFTQGRMIEPFDNLCFNVAIVGEYYRLETRFGQHIVQVLDRKSSGKSFSIQTLTYSTPIIVSEKSIKIVKKKAQKLIGSSKNIDALEKRMQEAGIAFEPGLPFSLMLDPIADWMDNAKHGEITMKPVKTYDFHKKKDKFLIMGIRVIKGSEISNEHVIGRFGQQIMKTKKAAIIEQELKEYSSLESIASKYNVAIREISLPYTGSMTSTDEMISVASIQNELFESGVKELTKPIYGYNGVYTAYVYWKK